jgi:hypothetical protein
MRIALRHYPRLGSYRVRWERTDDTKKVVESGFTFVSNNEIDAKAAHAAALTQAGKKGWTVTTSHNGGGRQVTLKPIPEA